MLTFLVYYIIFLLRLRGNGIQATPAILQKESEIINSVLHSPIKDSLESLRQSHLRIYARNVRA